jgi:NAD-dependent DNA ligase
MSDVKRTLPADELQLLDKAGDWGLIRNLSGRKVCMTGTMSLTRDQMARLIEAAGGQFTNTLNGTVNMLIVPGDKFGGYRSAKADKARREGVMVVSELEFVAGLLPTPEELLSGQRAAWGLR